MLGRRNMAPNPLVQSTDSYAQRANASLDIYNATVEPPATSYAATRSGLSSNYAVPTIGPKVDAAYVSRKERLKGLVYNWAWGGFNMGKQTVSLPGSDGGLNGFVRSTDSQPVLVQLRNWQTNRNWYIAWSGTGSGMFNGSKDVRYTYPSFRVPQIRTSVTGGPGPYTMRMGVKPKYNSVQAIKKYTQQPSYYNTRGTKS